MRLSRIQIENFKGIGAAQVIDLKPITLLFGPNSAGKSTILQSLHYLREILERRNADRPGAFNLLTDAFYQFPRDDSGHRCRDGYRCGGSRSPSDTSGAPSRLSGKFRWWRHPPGHAQLTSVKRSFLLAHHRKASKLPTFLREYDKVARLCAAEGVDYRLKFAGDVDHRAKTVRKGLSGSIRVVHTGRNKSSIQKAIRV